MWNPSNPCRHGQRTLNDDDDALVKPNFIPFATGSLNDARSMATKSSQDENDSVMFNKPQKLKNVCSCNLLF